MFYGRPAYRNPARTRPIKDVSYCPVCFVFRPLGSLPLKRIYPFDTGACDRDFYKPEISKAKGLAEYQVPAVMENARGIIDGFFETNDKYMKGEARVGMVFAAKDAAAKAYHKLIAGGGKQECDDRKSAVEIQSDHYADLSKDLLAVVLPTSFLDDEQLRATLMTVWRAHPLTYDITIGMRPTEFHGAIRALIHDYYRQWRLI